MKQGNRKDEIIQQLLYKHNLSLIKYSNQSKFGEKNKKRYYFNQFINFNDKRKFNDLTLFNSYNGKNNEESMNNQLSIKLQKERKKYQFVFEF